MNDPESQLTEDEVADQVLGTRPDCIMGLGYGPKPPPKRNSRRGTGEDALSEATRQRDELVEQIQAMQEAHARDMDAMQQNHAKDIEKNREEHNKLLESLIAAGIIPRPNAD